MSSRNWNSYSKPHYWKRRRRGGYSAGHRLDLQSIIAGAVVILLIAVVGRLF